MVEFYGKLAAGGPSFFRALGEVFLLGFDDFDDFDVLDALLDLELDSDKWPDPLIL